MDGLGGDGAGRVQQAAEEELQLSVDALAALKAFSLDKGLDVDTDAPSFRKVRTCRAALVDKPNQLQLTRCQM